MERLTVCEIPTLLFTITSTSHEQARSLLRDYNFPKQEADKDSLSCGVYCLLYIVHFFDVYDIITGTRVSTPPWRSKQEDIRKPFYDWTWTEADNGQGYCPILIRNVRDNIVIELVAHGLVAVFDALIVTSQCT